mgnify:FL=1
MNPASLVLEKVRKVHCRGKLFRRQAFELAADFALEGPGIVGVLGSNGAGKSTLFELIAGAQRPTEGRVFCGGYDVHRVRFHHRSRLVHHRQQKFSPRRSSFYDWSPLALRFYEALRRYRPVKSFAPAIHLFDEPDMRDEYMGLRLLHFHELRERGQLVLLCVHPHNARDLQIVRQLCDRYLFVDNGRIDQMQRFDDLLEHQAGKAYLGHLLPAAEAV